MQALVPRGERVATTVLLAMMADPQRLNWRGRVMSSEAVSHWWLALAQQLLYESLLYHKLNKHSGE